MRRVASLLLLIGACGGAPSADARNAPETRGEPCVEGDDCAQFFGRVDPADPPATTAIAPPPLVLPSGRSDRVTRAVPDLAVALAAYARLEVAPVSVDAPSADTATGIAELVARIRAASVIAREVSVACTSLEGATPRQRMDALTLEADALDLLASRLVTATLPLPLDLTAQIRDASPEVQSYVAREFRERITAEIAPETQRVFCLAARGYQQVLAIDPSDARASAQLAAYGEAFAASCGP